MRVFNGSIQFQMFFVFCFHFFYNNLKCEELMFNELYFVTENWIFCCSFKLKKKKKNNLLTYLHISIILICMYNNIIRSFTTRMETLIEMTCFVIFNYYVQLRPNKATLN
jgi:hypothetical protein